MFVRTVIWRLTAPAPLALFHDCIAFCDQDRYVVVAQDPTHLALRAQGRPPIPGEGASLTLHALPAAEGAASLRIDLHYREVAGPGGQDASYPSMPHRTEMLRTRDGRDQLRERLGRDRESGEAEWMRLSQSLWTYLSGHGAVRSGEEPSSSNAPVLTDQASEAASGPPSPGNLPPPLDASTPASATGPSTPLASPHPLSNVSLPSPGRGTNLARDPPPPPPPPESSGGARVYASTGSPGMPGHAFGGAGHPSLAQHTEATVTLGPGDHLVRVCQVIVKFGHEETYDRYVHELVLPQLRGRPGLVSVQAVRGASPNLAREVLIITEWQDLASLQTAAGAHWEQPQVDPAREGPLIQMAAVRHFRLLR